MRRATQWRIGAAAALFVFLGTVAALGLAEAGARPIERRATLALPGWPSDVPPLRVALLSDMHIGNRAMRPARLRSVVEQVNAARPDLVLIAGDFVTGHDHTGAVERAAALTEPLAALNAPLGVVAVLGNHDHWTAPNAIRAALSEANVTVLENDVARRGPLAVLGVGDAFSGHDDVRLTTAKARQRGGVPIVLTHAPDVAGKLSAALPLVLAGHTHCGQVVLPWFGPLLTRGPRQGWRRLYDPRYRCGIVRDPRRTVIVTAGLGSGTSPFRLGAPSDWWLLTFTGRLQRVQSSAGVRSR
jgi:hypothetical protein